MVLSMLCYSSVWRSYLVLFDVELLRPETEERSETKREVKVDITDFRKRGEIHETPLDDLSGSE